VQSCFAFFELAKRDPGFVRENTIVIATGSSNGGGAVLYGAEKDEQHRLDGVVAREPQVQLKPDDKVVVQRGTTERKGTGRTLLDYFSFGNLYQPCAVLAVPDIPHAARRRAGKCTDARAVERPADLAITVRT
jgi:hydroxybutyrate-dimer hydrolase